MRDMKPLEHLTTQSMTTLGRDNTNLAAIAAVKVEHDSNEFFIVF